MSTPLQNPIVHRAYAFALREYKQLGYHGAPNAEQYGQLLRLVAKNLVHLYPRMVPHERGAAARAGLDQALLDIAAGFPDRAGPALTSTAPDRVTQAWHSLGGALSRRLPTRLAAVGRARSALRRSVA